LIELRTPADLGRLDDVASGGAPMRHGRCAQHRGGMTPATQQTGRARGEDATITAEQRQFPGQQRRCR